MAPNHHRRTSGVPGRGQPGAVLQPKVQRGLGRAERPRVLGPGRQERQEVQQLLVAVGDRLGLHQAPVGKLDNHPVVPGDDHVLHRWVVQQRLQPTQPEERVEHRIGQPSGLRERPSLATLGHRHRVIGRQQGGDDRASEFLLLRLRHPRLLPDRLGQRRGRVPPEPGDLRPVQTGRWPGDRTQAGRESLGGNEERWRRCLLLRGRRKAEGRPDSPRPGVAVDAGAPCEQWQPSRLVEDGVSHRLVPPSAAAAAWARTLRNGLIGCGAGTARIASAAATSERT